MTEAPTRAPTVQPGDTITLPGGQSAVVIESGMTEHVVEGADRKQRVVRNGFLIVSREK